MGIDAVSSSHFVAHDVAQFSDAVSRSFVPLHVTSDVRGSFVGSIRGIELDQLLVSEITAARHVAERTRDLIGQGDRPYLKVSWQLAGSALIAQSGREALLLPGDLSICDTNQPYTLVLDSSYRMIVLMFPQSMFDIPPDSLSQLLAVRFDGTGGTAALIQPLLRQLVGRMGHLNGSTSSRLGRNILDLVATMFAGELGAPRGREALAARIRDYIDAHLGDPTLSPAKIAAAHYISTRHLHGIFHEQGESVSAWIRAQRLERSRRDLLDPMLRDRMISNLASRWGFTDPAHFSRLYRATFDESPRDTRSWLR